MRGVSRDHDVADEPRPAPMRTPASTMTERPDLDVRRRARRAGRRSAVGWMRGPSALASWALAQPSAIDDAREQLALGAQRAVDARLAAQLPHVGAVMDAP